MAAWFAVCVLACAAAGFSCLPATAQTGTWAWMGGSDINTQNIGGEPGQPGVYGIEGYGGTANISGGRTGGVSWTDSNGNFWLFGGSGLDSTGTFGFLNDLWEFNPTSKDWTWMSGSSTIPGANEGQPGVYGKMSLPSKSSTPGGRSGAAAWADQQGNLWLFGGDGIDADGNYGSLNDLWEYSTATNEWAWMGGTSSLGGLSSVAGYYGPEGSLTGGSYPGGRYSSVTWKDSEGNLWLFGGYGADSNNQAGDLNDLWKYVPETNRWAWIDGSSTIKGAGWSGVYGQLNIRAPGNMPGARDSAAGWVDASGNLWLFGGQGYTTTKSGTVTNGFLNDMWEYTPSLNQWRWRGGSNQFPTNCAYLSTPICGSFGLYGTLGTASPANIPGSRYSPVIWMDVSGNVWMLGGRGLATAGSSVHLLNDLWEFNPIANDWAWMGGANSGQQDSVYGTLGVAAAENAPGERQAAVGWTGTDGYLWLMGGDGLDGKGTLGVLNDLWEYEAPLPAATFDPTAGTYASAQSVSVTDANAGATIYYTTDGTTPTMNSTVYSGSITVSASETIKVLAVASGYAPSAVASASYAINISSPNVGSPGFTIAISPNALTLDSTGSATTGVMVMPQNGFNSAVSLACVGLPSGATCSFSSASLTPQGGAASSQLKVTMNSQAKLERRGGPWLPESTLALAACFLVWKRRADWRRWVVLTVVLAGVGALSGCSAQLRSISAPQSSQTFPLTVTATSGAMQQTATVTVTMN